MTIPKTTRIFGTPQTVTMGLIVTYFVYFSLYSLQRHAAFQTNAYDLCFYAQSLWNTVQGELMRVTIQPPYTNYFQIHMSPALLLLTPLYALIPRPEALLVVQSLAIASGAWPVFRLATDHTRSEWMGVAFAAIYMLHPAVQTANLYDYHEITMAAPTLAWAGYFAAKQHWIKYTAFAMLAGSMREEVVLFLIMFGVILACRKETRKAGWLTVICALVWLGALYMWLFSPSGGQTNGILHFSNRWQLGMTPLDALQNILQNPGLLAERLFNAEKLYYLGRLFAPVGFLSILAPEVFLPALPYLGLNLLNVSLPAHETSAAQFNILLVPFVVISAAAGAGRLLRRLGNETGRTKRWQVLLSIYVLGIVLLMHTRLPFLPISQNFAWPEVTERNRLAEEIAGQIPGEASLSTNDHLAAHACNRRDLHLFQIQNRAEFIYLDLQFVEDLKRDGVMDLSGAVNEVLNNNDYRLIRSENNLLLLQRQSP